MWSHRKFELQIKKIDMDRMPKLQKITGRVAVIAQDGSFYYYYHWLTEILARLALLEMQGVDYDWLYTNYNIKYMKETLALFGVDESKIIEASDDLYIQADELIVPSSVGVIIPRALNRHASYAPEWAIDFLRKKFVPLLQKGCFEENFDSKVFISRQDAKVRRVINEDELFEKFEKLGFKKYCLSGMSCLDQMKLFN